MKRCILYCLLLIAGVTQLFSLDRNAFTITSYRLDAQVDRNSHVLAVTGRLILRNDSKLPQKTASLQVSSQLAWNGIGTDSKPADCDCVVWPAGQELEWLGQNYTSDIDHTGSLSEAIVTLPKAVAPGASVVLDIQYGGRITADTTRLTRMGVPQEIALRNDWDQISEPFTAVRGLGYVLWYPVSIDAVSMSDGIAVSDAIALWKARHRSSKFFSYVSVPVQNDNDRPCILSNAAPTGGYFRVSGGIVNGESTGAKPAQAYPQNRGITLQTQGLENTVPAFVLMTNCDSLSRPAVEINFSPDHSLIAKDYAAAAEANEPVLDEWAPVASNRAIKIIELTDPNASPYQDGATLFAPLQSATQQNLQLFMVPTQVAARFNTPRAWIQKGLGLFLQAMLERGHGGRDAALKFLDQYEAPMAKAEELARAAKPSNAGPQQHSDSDETLLNTSDELYLRVKGGFVFWMLRDLLDDTVLQHALAAYRADADKEPTYFQKLLEAQTRRDLEWFFDDWVYRDRGLPDFRVPTAFARKLLNSTSSSNQYQVTATIENVGDAGAEVPVSVATAKGEKTVRVLVRAHDKGYARVDLPELPTRVVVNDGSVPESDTNNNTYQFEASPRL
jgi:hypothetical protein